MFEYGGEWSATSVRTDTFEAWRKTSEEQTWTMTPGVPWYLYKWELTSEASDDTYIRSESNAYCTMSTSTPPEDVYPCPRGKMVLV